jgi:galactokinase
MKGDLSERGLDEELARHARRFEQHYGQGAPVRSFFAPGRVNLMGAHLDYNGGPVMPMALGRGTFVALRPRTDDRVRLASTLEPESVSARLGSLPGSSSGRWFDYPLGVLVELHRRERPAIGADVLFGGNLPVGAGLSSSASICVGTAFAFRSLWGLDPDPHACIEAALWGEREWVGVQCGIMDPFAVALARPGHVLWLECRDSRYEHLPFETRERMVALVDSGVRRELAKGDFNRRVAECQEAFRRLQPRAREARVLCDVPKEAVSAAAAELGPVLLRRARHVTEEFERTRSARAALLTGDAVEFGRCIRATHASLRDLYEVSVPELDCIVESASEVPGVLGARLTGAGFGGCALILFERPAQERLADQVQAAFERRFARRPPLFFFESSGGPREVT